MKKNKNKIKITIEIKIKISSQVSAYGALHRSCREHNYVIVSAKKAFKAYPEHEATSDIIAAKEVQRGCEKLSGE